MTVITVLKEDASNVASGYVRVYPLSKIYNPNLNQTSGSYIVPQVDSLVIDVDNGGLLYYVESVNEITNVSTLVPAKIITDSIETELDQISVISYGNDLFYLYYDPLNTPTDIDIDSKLHIVGPVGMKYQIIENVGTATEKVISQYYDIDGNYVGNVVPMVPCFEDGTKGVHYLKSCYTTQPIVDGTSYQINVFNSAGKLIGEVKNVISKKSYILNNGFNSLPVINNLSIVGNQMRNDNEIYIYQNQNIDSLNIRGILTFEDGRTQEVLPDTSKCVLYGFTNFVSSYPGYKQPLLLKYMLDSDEPISRELMLTNDIFITGETNLIVIPNNVSYGIKLLVVPQWSANLNQYTLKFFLYSTERNSSVDVTQYVTTTSLDTSTGLTNFSGNYYTGYQTLQASIDLNNFDNTTFGVGSIYLQTIVIKLQPFNAYNRYIFGDSITGTIYGIDNTLVHRPVLYNDIIKNVYFIPSSLFSTVDNFLQAFYYNTLPVYDSSNTSSPPVPTHFCIRDIVTGNMLTNDTIPIANYQQAFNFVNNTSYLNNNVLIEFIQQINTTTNNTLYGAPIDVYSNTYIPTLS